MKSAKLIVSALAVVLLATPSFAQKPSSKSPGQSTAYVVVDGTVVGADPDVRIRSALEREWYSLHGE